MYQHIINLGSQAKEEIPASAVRESEKDGKAGEKKTKRESENLAWHNKSQAKWRCFPKAHTVVGSVSSDLY